MIFDGAQRLIVLEAADGNSIGVVDMYSRWKDWVLTGDNSKWLDAFAPLGGDPIDPLSGTAVPLYAFLTNGWRVRPREASHSLSVTEGILLVDGGGDPFVNTLGSYVVRINYQQPVQAITVSGGGGFTQSDRDAVAAIVPAIKGEVWGELLGSQVAAGTFGEAVSLILGLVQSNFVLDSMAYNSAGVMTSGRIRIFGTPAEASSETSPLATFQVTTTAAGELPSKYKVVRQ